MRMRVAHVGAVIAGCAIALAAPAVGAQKPAPVPEVAAAHTEHAAPITIRQILAYGRQNTWAAGVKLTERGNAYFGRAGKLRSRLGGWTLCANGIGFTATPVVVTMTGLGGPSCRVSEVAVTSVHSPARGTRLVTDLGTVRVGQKWRTVPKKLRSRVRVVDRSFRSLDGTTKYWIGRYQNYCKPHQPLPVRWQRPDTPSPVAIAVHKTGRVDGVEVHPMIVEGVSCE